MNITYYNNPTLDITKADFKYINNTIETVNTEYTIPSEFYYSIIRYDSPNKLFRYNSSGFNELKLFIKEYVNKITLYNNNNVAIAQINFESLTEYKWKRVLTLRYDNSFFLLPELEIHKSEYKDHKSKLLRILKVKNQPIIPYIAEYPKLELNGLISSSNLITKSNRIYYMGQLV